MKKAFAWLAAHAVPYNFMDYGQVGVSVERLADWSRRVGWQCLLNTRGTTWRRLTMEERSNIDEHKALKLMAAQPSLIRRPVIDTGNALLIGFEPLHYAAHFVTGNA